MNIVDKLVWWFIIITACLTWVKLNPKLFSFLGLEGVARETMLASRILTNSSLCMVSTSYLHVADYDKCHTQLCTRHTHIAIHADNQLQQVSITRAPVEYDRGVAQQPSGCTISGDSAFCSPSILLTNGQPGSQSLNVNDGFAWNNESDVTIIIALNISQLQETIITGVNLYFYNIPSMGIGLPHEIELTWGTFIIEANNPLEHVILWNQDLALDDNVLRNVTIVATNNGSMPYKSVGITFRFSDENRIRWLLLTEIEVCNEGNLYQLWRVLPIL